MSHFLGEKLIPGQMIIPGREADYGRFYGLTGTAENIKYADGLRAWPRAYWLPGYRAYDRDLGCPQPRLSVRPRNRQV